MLKLDLKPGESIQVGDAVIHIRKKAGQIVSLVIDADRSIPVKRKSRQDDSEQTQDRVNAS